MGNAIKPTMQIIKMRFIIPSLSKERVSRKLIEEYEISYATTGQWRLAAGRRSDEVAAASNTNSQFFK
jgi:hypothetical protein